MADMIARISGGLGRAVGTFQRALQQARSPAVRPGFLTTWAESERWSGGDYGMAEAAQQRALQNSWLYSAVEMVAKEVSAARIQVYRYEVDQEEPVVIPNHPYVKVLRRPNPVMGRSYLWRYTASWLCLAGNSYWFKTYGDDGRLKEIWPLPAASVEPWPGNKDRFVDYYEFTINGQRFEIPAEYIVHFQFPNPHDVYRGLSPLVAGMLPVDADTAMARWNGAFFGRNNTMPSAVINLSSGDSSTPVASEDVDRIADQLREEYAAAERKTLVTNAPHQVQVALLGWSAKDMDFLAGRQFTKDEIYAIYNIPGGLMDKNATEANAIVADKIFKEKTIWPLLTLMAEQITAQLIIPDLHNGDYEAIFDDIRPADKQMQIQELGAARGALTVNEVRQRYYSMPALPGSEGEQLYGSADPAAAPPFVMSITPPAITQSSEPTKSEPVIAEIPELPAAPVPVPAPVPIQDSAMLALYVPVSRANAIALTPQLLAPNAVAVPPDNLHVTTLYLGKIAELNASPDDILKIARPIAQNYGPMIGTVSGVVRFQGSESGPQMDSFCLTLDVPGLSEMHAELCMTLEDGGYSIAHQHPQFVAHITLAELPRDCPAPHVDYTGMVIHFPALCLAWGDERFNIELPTEAGQAAPVANPTVDPDRYLQDDNFAAIFDRPDLDRERRQCLDDARREYLGEIEQLTKAYRVLVEVALRNGSVDGCVAEYERERRSIQRDYRQRVFVIAQERSGNAAVPGKALQIAIDVELRRWQKKALKALEDGKLAGVGFESEILSPDIQDWIAAGLADAETPEEVKSVFAGVDVSAAGNIDIGQVLEELKRANAALEALANAGLQ
jgi:HK97 family phage portal protein